MPDFTTASAMPLIKSSLTLQANLFQEFHPMGGVRASPEEGEAFSWADAVKARHETKRQHDATTLIIFMRMLYQNFLFLRQLSSELGISPTLERFIHGDDSAPSADPIY